MDHKLSGLPLPDPELPRRRPAGVALSRGWRTLVHSWAALERVRSRLSAGGRVKNCQLRLRLVCLASRARGRRLANLLT